jgi:hypothetical protein
MAGPFFVDDGGNGTTGLSWATAETNILDLDTAQTFASGELVYFGSDSVDPYTYAANLTITGPSATPPLYLISSTVGAGTTVSYAASTSNQIDTSDGAYNVTFSGSFALYGISVKSGNDINAISTNRYFYAENSRFAIGANRSISFATQGFFSLESVVVDLTADGTTNRSAQLISISGSGLQRISRLSFVNAAYRTGSIFSVSAAAGDIVIDGSDFSGFTNGTSCEIVGGDNYGAITISNCLTAATWVPVLTVPRLGGCVFITNTGPADDPTYLYMYTIFGLVVSSSAIYRSTGATIEGANTSWLVTTSSVCSEGSPFTTPWIYFKVSSTGSKTFDLYTANDTADFTDAQVWLEVEYFGTADEANTSLVSDHRTITTTAANQTDDTSSTWNGSGPSFTYKQKLSCSATVNETGMHRARVAVGVASIAGSRFFYIDPQITVT